MINKNLENELDEQFPKGDKARGRALVLFAIAQMEIKKAQDKILDEVEELCKRYENDGAFTQGDLIRELRNRKDKK